MPWIEDLLVRTSITLSFSPLGKILAEVLEEFYDQKARFSEANWRGRLLPPSYLVLTSRRVTFITAAFSLLAKMAYADKVLKRSEAVVVNDFIEKILGLSARDARFAREVFHAGGRSRSSFKQLAQEFHQKFKSSTGVLENMVEVLRTVAEADGEMTSTEREFINSAIKIFKLPESILVQLDARRIRARRKREDYFRIRERLRPVTHNTFDFEARIDEEVNSNRNTRQKNEEPARSELVKAFEILGVTQSDSLVVIKRKYRKLVLQHHPDRLQSQGVPAEFIKISEAKFRQIQNAYDLILATRNADVDRH